MKSDWFVFFGTLAFLGIFALETKFWIPQRNFLSVYRKSEKLAQTAQVSWIERVFYAAALSAKSGTSPQRIPEIQACPRLLLNPGPKI